MHAKHSCYRGVLIVLFWALASQAAQETGSAPPPSGETAKLHVIIFTNAGCPGCEFVEPEHIDKLAKGAGVSIESSFYEVSESANYRKLVWAEKALHDTANELPVAIIGKKILGGEKELKEGFQAALRDYASQPPGERFELVFPPEGAPEAPKAPDAGKPVYLAYFYRPGCSGCRRAEYMLQYVGTHLPGLRVTRYPQDQAQNILRLEASGERIGVAEKERLKTPVGLIGQDRFYFDRVSDGELEVLVRKYADGGSEAWWNGLDLSQAKQRLLAKWRTLTLGAVIAGGLIDGINPCAFATLILFVSMVTISAGRRKHLLALSLSFIGGVFCAYFLIGLGLTEIVGWLSGVPVIKATVNYGIAGLCIILSGLSVYDFFKARRGRHTEVVLQLPASVKSRVRSVVARFGRARFLAPAGFVTGLLIAGLELVCTGQMYLPIIQLMSMMSPTRAANLGWLTVYNLSFIIPLGGVFVLVYFGTTSDALTAFLKKHLSLAKAVAAVFFASIAALLLATV